MDYTVGDPNNPVELTRYLASYGVQQAESVDPNGSTTLKVGYNGNMLRSTMFLSEQDGSGAPTAPAVAYTAFGELVTQNSQLETRYSFAGGWGYESGYITLQGANTTLAPITLQHVGARWY